jgi:hypothetical protein
MSPSKFLLQFIRLVSLFPGLRSLLETHSGFIECGLEVRNSFPFLRKYFCRLGNVLETCVVLVAKLAQLSTTQEELARRNMRKLHKVEQNSYLVFVRWMRST